MGNRRVAMKSRMMLVLGNARKAKLCWKETLLVQDFHAQTATLVSEECNSAREQELSQQALSRVTQAIDDILGLQPDTIDEVLFAYNQVIIFHKVVRRVMVAYACETGPLVDHICSFLVRRCG